MPSTSCAYKPLNGAEVVTCWCILYGNIQSAQFLNTAMISINGCPHNLLFALLLNYIIFYCGNQQFTVRAENSLHYPEHVAKVIADRQSVLRKIARSNVDGLCQKECSKSSFVVITEYQFGEDICLLYQMLQQLLVSTTCKMPRQFRWLSIDHIRRLLISPIFMTISS